MPLSETPVVRFLRSMTSQDPAAESADSSSHFADQFMAVNPQGTFCVRAADFASAISKRKQVFTSHGHRSTTLLSVQETPLDAGHVLAQTHWRFTFDRASGHSVEVDTDSVFILDTSGDSIKIIFYLNSQDPLTLLQLQAMQTA